AHRLLPEEAGSRPGLLQDRRLLRVRVRVRRRQRRDRQGSPQHLTPHAAADRLTEGSHMATTPAEWLPILAKRMDARAPRITLLRKWADGDAPLPELGRNTKAAWE